MKDIMIKIGNQHHKLLEKLTNAVGVSGDATKYIHTSDYDPTATDYQFMTGGGSNSQGTPELLASETAILATWSNVGGSNGRVNVRLTYSIDNYESNEVAVPA